jgi:hypothetical protein
MKCNRTSRSSELSLERAGMKAEKRVSGRPYIRKKS